MRFRAPGIAEWLPFIGSVVGWFFLHLLFLSADPGLHIGPSRDAWTDEGIYTAQLRNYIHTHNFSLDENPTFFKTPLFNFLLTPFFILFGTRLEAARLAVLIFAIAFFLWGGRTKKNRPFFLIALYTGFCQIFVFSYSHLAMAEIPGVIFIAMAIFLFSEWPMADSLMGRIRVLLMVQLLFGCAFLTKASYGYILFFLPVILLVWSVVRGLQKHHKPRQILSFATIGIMSAFIFVMLYWIVWVIPNNDLALKIWRNEAVSRFADLRDIPGTVKFWITHVYFNSANVFHSILFLIVSAFFLTLLAMKKIRSGWTGFLWLAWVVFEFHKLILMDQPPRYQVSLLASIGFLVAYMVRCIQLSQNRWIKLSAIFIVSLYAGKFSGDIRTLYVQRTYSVQQANREVAGFTNSNDTIIGPWAGTLSWQSKAYSIPSWDEYFNHEHILVNHHPSYLVSEPNEEDSEQVFSSDGIVLDSANAHKMKIGYWNVFIYPQQISTR